MPKPDKYDEAAHRIGYCCVPQEIFDGGGYNEYFAASILRSAFPSVPSDAEPAPSSEKALREALDNASTQFESLGISFLDAKDSYNYRRALRCKRDIDTLLSSSPAPSESPQSAPDGRREERSCETCGNMKYYGSDGCKIGGCSIGMEWTPIEPERSEP